MQDFVKEAEAKMKQSIEVLRKNLAGVRTGRASPALVDNVMVEYYGAPTPLKTLANIAIPEPRQIAIQPYDKTAVQGIEKAIQKSDLGLNPKIDGGVIRLMLPPLNEERRKELIKVLKKDAEETKVAVRNIRRDTMDHLKAARDKKEISEDIEKSKEGELQKLTDKETAEVDKILAAKEKEIMEV